MTSDALLAHGFNLQHRDRLDLRSHLYPKMSPKVYRHLAPWAAKRRLWGQVPGIYECWRTSHHDMFIKGDKVLEPRRCTSADIADANGESHFIRRTPTDPSYESELLLKTIILLDTKTGDRAYWTEHHVFRLQNGEWSYWTADEEGIVKRKIRDLQYKYDYLTDTPQLRGTDQPWDETYGQNVYLGLDFNLKDSEPSLRSLRITHRIKWKDGQNTAETTLYIKVREFEQEGWSKCLMNKMKTGYQRWKARHSRAKG